MAKTVLSAGIIVRKLLQGLSNKVYPIIDNESKLPYITYRRQGLDVVNTKVKPSDTAVIEVDVYAATYDESVSLAEQVRDKLEYNQSEANGLKMRSCVLDDAAEDWVENAYKQSLIFRIKI